MWPLIQQRHELRQRRSGRRAAPGSLLATEWPLPPRWTFLRLLPHPHRPPPRDSRGANRPQKEKSSLSPSYRTRRVFGWRLVGAFESCRGRPLDRNSTACSQPVDLPSTGLRTNSLTDSLHQARRKRLRCSVALKVARKEFLAIARKKEVGKASPDIVVDRGLPGSDVVGQPVDVFRRAQRDRLRDVVERWRRAADNGQASRSSALNRVWRR